MTPAAGARSRLADTAAVVEAAIRLVEGRRRYLELPADRPLPGGWEADLERAVAALAAERHGRRP